MVQGVFITAIIIILSILSTKLSHRVGIPSLLFFIALGLFFGSDGIVKIPFDDYKLVEIISSIALIFIMFYGGFGTRWKTAKSVSIKAFSLSTFGVLLTALLVGLFSHYILKIAFLESFLIGAVVGSTDAASVFSVLRSKKLALKDNTDSLLELESGSNDPTAYMITIIILKVMEDNIDYSDIIPMILLQFGIGILFAGLLAFISLKIYKYFDLETNGLENVFIVSMVLLSFALPIVLGGNGYLSTYIFGIILGNHYMKNKKVLVSFFDGITGLMQISIFFLLGLLAFPSQIPDILLIAIFIALFLTFIARPLATFIILKPMKSSLSQIALVSWSGIRGASSIVFAIMATVSPAYLKNDIFHIVFFIVLFSIGLQGSLLPFIAKKLHMIDKDEDILRTFTDYKEENELQLIRLFVTKKHPWVSLNLKEIILPPDLLIVSIVRDKKILIPNGENKIYEDDIIILTAPGAKDPIDVNLNEIIINKNHKWIKKQIKDIKIPHNSLVVMIKRDGDIIVPNGDTLIEENDIVVMTNVS